jgi:DNA-binding response OmpR family regulator
MDKTVLIIDDDEQILELLKMFIENNQCLAETAASAEKGLALARKKEYALILLDIMLPDGDGLTVLRNIKKSVSSIPVIMITGGNDITVAEQCLEEGAVDYITKPFDFEYLRTTIIANMLASS